ncbi:MAG: GatB/YqeY domain-containing protein [Chloroflexota bacterium]
MALQEKIMADLKQAMKSGDKDRVAVIRMARAAIKNAEIAKGHELDDSEVIDVLSKEVKQRNESIDELKKANRPDLLEKEEKALSILKEFLPEQMSEEDIAEAARKVIDEVGATSPREKGKVMSKLMPELKGKADGRLISEVVDRLLNES